MLLSFVSSPSGPIIHLLFANLETWIEGVAHEVNANQLHSMKRRSAP
ncbi:MAG: hypothetical protein WAK01_07815 [Methylocystis sp.]